MTFLSQSKFLVLLSILTLSSPAMAYMGPGAGLTAIGSLIALLAGIWYTFRGFLWLPLKRKFKKKAAVDEAQKEEAQPEQVQEHKETK